MRLRAISKSPDSLHKICPKNKSPAKERCFQHRIFILGLKSECRNPSLTPAAAGRWLPTSAASSRPAAASGSADPSAPPNPSAAGGGASAMDFTAPSFSLGSEFDDDEPSPPARSDRYEQARGYTAPDAPSFSLGIDSEGEGDGGGDQSSPPVRNDRYEQARGYTAPDAPSFSLGIDFEGEGDGGDELHLTNGSFREEQRPRYEAPDAPSFTLDIGSDGDGDPHLTDRGRREEPARHYEAPDAPSFSLGFDDEDDDILIGGGLHEEARHQVAPRSRTSLGTVEEEETLVADQIPPPPKMAPFKRLRRGPAPPPPPLAPTPPPYRTPVPAAMEASPVMSSKAGLESVWSLEDEVENYSDEEKSLRDMPPSGGSCITSSNSKFSLLSNGVLLSQSTSKAMKFAHTPNYSVSKSLEASCSKKLLPKITLSPMRKILLLDSDSDSDDNKDKPTLQQSSKPQENTGIQMRKAEKDSWTTPALDDFCNEYFKSVKDSRPSQQKEGISFGGSKVRGSNNSVSETGGHFPHQSTLSGAALDLDENLIVSHPPAMHYFFHHDPLVCDLVRQRLQHFVPIGADRNKGEQIGAENLNYRRRSDQCASANDRWVTPNRGASVATEVGTRRANASGISGTGHWFTGDDGNKVYVAKNGQELTGRAAYRQYKKESGKGFRQSKKKSSAGTKRGSKKATTTAKQGKTTAKRKR
ncbi:hypothetical protein GUJ93_ZPchr0004g39052 [Zizania palustris]|uniref:Uncharacterized protein n=1 Tax=Zizania palustris TaxID=103762 RepID=A0A8J5T2L1_ZIZPA|nr:hypothetical protein GUJ93_ZPchr0004g39052 [Zizania palustris]